MDLTMATAIRHGIRSTGEQVREVGCNVELRGPFPLTFARCITCAPTRLAGAGRHRGGRLREREPALVSPGAPGSRRCSPAHCPSTPPPGRNRCPQGPVEGFVQHSLGADLLAAGVAHSKPVSPDSVLPPLSPRTLVVAREILVAPQAHVPEARCARG